MSSKFGEIRPWTTELAALERKAKWNATFATFYYVSCLLHCQVISPYNIGTCNSKVSVLNNTYRYYNQVLLSGSPPHLSDVLLLDFYILQGCSDWSDQFLSKTSAI